MHDVIVVYRCTERRTAARYRAVELPVLRDFFILKHGKHRTPKTYPQNPKSGSKSGRRNAFWGDFSGCTTFAGGGGEWEGVGGIAIEMTVFTFLYFQISSWKMIDNVYYFVTTIKIARRRSIKIRHRILTPSLRSIQIRNRSGDCDRLYTNNDLLCT